MTEFIFVRHGESKANANGTLAKPDTKLSAVGIQQARQTGQDLKNLGITKIVCSPMLRAQQTAEIIAGEIGIDLAHIEIIDDLQERRIGKLEGTPKTRDSNWYVLSDEEPTFEKSGDLLKRMNRCLETLKKLSNTDKVLAVGHSASGYYLLQVAEGKKTIEDFGSPAYLLNAEYVIVKI